MCSVSSRSSLDVGSLSYGKLKLSKHFPGLHCNVTISTAASNRVFITFLDIFLRVRSTNSSGTRKCLDFVKVLDGKSNHEICGKLHYSESDQLVFFSSPGKNTVTLEFYVSDSRMKSDEMIELTLVYTCFQMIKNGICNELDSYMCRNGACISDSLLDDGYNNCGDLSDEKCLQDNCGTRQVSPWTYAGIVISVLAFFVIALFVIVPYRRNRNARRSDLRLSRPETVNISTVSTPFSHQELPSISYSSATYVEEKPPSYDEVVRTLPLIGPGVVNLSSSLTSEA
ncbi:uncharacterized protein LOC111088661 isoform X2 [Limulus polyphemus]|nr:uncharacterized protein LOC111088661 isoform X2 [Limulus polyphemus]